MFNGIFSNVGWNLKLKLSAALEIKMWKVFSLLCFSLGWWTACVVCSRPVPCQTNEKQPAIGKNFFPFNDKPLRYVVHSIFFTQNVFPFYSVASWSLKAYICCYHGRHCRRTKPEICLPFSPRYYDSMRKLRITIILGWHHKLIVELVTQIWYNTSIPMAMSCRSDYIRFVKSVKNKPCKAHRLLVVVAVVWQPLLEAWGLDFLSCNQKMGKRDTNGIEKIFLQKFFLLFLPHIFLEFEG